MAIVEEPFSIGRLLRSAFKRSSPAHHRDQPAPGGNDDEQSAPLSRDQLLSAREKIQHQIELLEYGANHSRGGPSQNPMLIAELQRTREHIDAELHDQDQSDAFAEVEDSETLEVSNMGDPSALSAFNYSVTNVARARDGALWAEYLLVCKDCVGGDMFSIISYPKIAPDPSPYADVAPGATVHLPPYNARCVECGHEKTVFDPRTAGRHAVMNGISRDTRAADEPVDETGATTLYVSLIYRTEPGALRDQAVKANVPVADLFEAIHIRGMAPNGATAFEEYYECP